MKKLLYAFVLGICFSVLYSRILLPIHLTVKYGDKVKDILEKKHSEYSDLWVLVQGETKYVVNGVILNTGQSFLVKNIEFIKDNYENAEVMIVGDKKWENLNTY